MKILYAEDERRLSVAVAEILKGEHYDVDAVYDGEEAWRHIQNHFYDAVVMDIMMPKMDGIQVLEAMRQHDIFTPVLMLTAKSSVDDRIEGLSAGADDYLGKPFSMKELLARLNSMLRRSTEYRDNILRCGNISLDCNTNELKSNVGSLRLSGKESELLTILMKRSGDPVTSDELNRLLWNGSQNDNTVFLYVSYLKTKLTQLHADIRIAGERLSYQIKEG